MIMIMIMNEWMNELINEWMNKWFHDFLVGLEHCESFEMKQAATAQSTLKRQPGGRLNFQSYANIFFLLDDPNLRIKRENVTLKELIGGGQFGNVYKGVYNAPVRLLYHPCTVSAYICSRVNRRCLSPWRFASWKTSRQTRSSFFRNHVSTVGLL